MKMSRDLGALVYCTWEMVDVGTEAESLQNESVNES
jgi:hypothetical protein